MFENISSKRYKTKTKFLNIDYSSNYRDAHIYDMSDHYLQAYMGEISSTLSASRSEIVSKIRSVMVDFTGSDRIYVNMIDSHTVTISYFINENEDNPPYIFVSIYTSDSNQRSFDTNNFSGFTSTTITYKVCDYDLGVKFGEALGSIILPLSHPSVEWHFENRGSIDVRKLFLPNPKNTINDYHYPYIVNGVDNYQNDYFNSDSPILLMSGPPGTGKTTFLRDMIYKHKKSCVMTFDEKVMQSDQFFVNFITSSMDIMVIEDADTLLTSRESDGNKTMSKILNASDGLIKMDTKKIVFTTNVLDLDRVDSALVRPGRCFDTIHFRKLNHIEASKVAKESGIDKTFEEGQDYSLAEIYEDSTTKGSVRNAETRKFGFI